MKLSVATFNIENLLGTLPGRFDDGSTRWTGPLRFLKRERMAAPEAVHEALQVLAAHEKCKLAALTLTTLDADVICLQEVESEAILRQFRNEYLDPLTDGAYKHLKLSEGNDGRGIDVAVLSRRPLGNSRHIADVRFADIPGAWSDDVARTVDRFRAAPSDPPRLRYPKPTDFIFRRGLLWVDVTVGDATVTVYVAHLKSMGSGLEPTFTDDRTLTAPLRRAEALAIRHLVTGRHGADPHAFYVVAGDLNDYAWRNGQPVANLAISPLLDPAFAANVLEDLPPDERWTHWWPQENAFSQLDYVLISPALRRANPTTVPNVERRGMPWRMPWRAATAMAGPGWVPGPDTGRRAMDVALAGLARFPGVGWEDPRASDHAALAVELTVPQWPPAGEDPA